ncbi:MAG: peptidoglycan-binding protein [Limnochordaceae bacterium]|nr:peptidoglycan-binding protein [Limnochordaceae bacterium]
MARSWRDVGRPARRRGRATRRLGGLVTLGAVAALAGWAAVVASAGALAAGPPPGACLEVGTVGKPGEPSDPDAVRELQLGLRLLGEFRYPVDGRYDPRTREAVREFQRLHGLPADGVAGPATWDALARAYQEEAASVVQAQRGAAQSAPPPEHVPRRPDLEPDGYWIIIDTHHLQLTLYKGHDVVGRWPVAVGKPSTLTPVGEWRISHKDRDWGGGFGTRWMRIDVPWGIYGIHGTNKPWSIGTRASGGCIRMFNEDVEKLWEMVPRGTPVTIVGVLPEASWDTPIEAGSDGWNVPVLQWALRDHGFPVGRADGKMGPETMRGVAEAQRQLGLPPVPAATVDLFRALQLRR